MKVRLVLSLAALMLFLPAVISMATELTITRDGCGTQKLCLEEPTNCDPSGNNSCLFLSSTLNGTDLSFELSGSSPGYIAMGLTMNASQGMTMLFICGRNESFLFNTARRNNSSPDTAPMITNRTVTQVRGQVKNDSIRCEFTVPDLNFTNINYIVLLGNGNSTNGKPGVFQVLLTTNRLNLTMPSSGSTNPTTPSPPTTPTPALIITRNNCGTSKLCLEIPENCDPAGNTECLFTSLVIENSMSSNGINLLVELRGDSDGYIALALTPSATPETAMVFICAQNSSNNGSFFFNIFQLNNSDPNAAFTPLNRNVSNVQGQVTGNVIRCVFKVPDINSTRARNAATTFAVAVGSGSVNGSSFGRLRVALNRSSLNLGNPALGSSNPPAAPLIINRNDCGTRKLCLEVPETCDPAGNGTCLFGSFVVSTVMTRTTLDLLVELRGESDGYIGLGLTPTATPETAMLFICARNSSNNGTFFFDTFQLNNSDASAAPTSLNRNATIIQGQLTGNVIRCVFRVPDINSTRARNADTTFRVALGSGSINGAAPGPFNATLTRTLNLANTSLGSNNMTTAAPVTTQVPPSTTCDGVSSCPHALLLLSALILSIMLRN